MRKRSLGGIQCLAAIAALCCLGAAEADKQPEPGVPEVIRGVYLTSISFDERRTTETIQYAAHTGMNAVVLHVKDPFGHVFWKSENPVAKEIGAVQGKGQLERAVQSYNEAGMWTIAKLDVFQDTLLAEKRPQWAVQDGGTGKPWRDRKKLAWSNPYEREVWDYVIALAGELMGLGFDEIQFDYVRFPSDGDMKRITYPVVLDGLSKTETIGAFLEAANAVLKPLGATISVDLFGFVAWKKDDFGVGQRLEEIAPHVDAICPMFYPSHFPPGFLGKDDPGKYPREIMESSMRRYFERTDVAVRPWLQGFWYTPDDIIAQMEAVEASGVQSWLIWNPASNYEVTYEAFAKRLGRPIPEPKLYPELAELEPLERRELQGAERVVHFTDYGLGYTMLRLETVRKEGVPAYTTPTALIRTLDEAVMDLILAKRGVEAPRRAGKGQKAERLVTLMCRDLNVSANRMSTKPIYVHWRGDCRFSGEAPDPARAGDVPRTEAHAPAETPGADPAPQGIPSGG